MTGERVNDSGDDSGGRLKDSDALSAIVAVIVYRKVRKPISRSHRTQRETTGTTLIVRVLGQLILGPFRVKAKYPLLGVPNTGPSGVGCLLRRENPCPQGKVRVQRLCHLND